MALQPELDETRKPRVRFPRITRVICQQHAQGVWQAFARVQCKVFHNAPGLSCLGIWRYYPASQDRNASNNVTDKTNPIRPTDDTARKLARGLLAQARHGALGVLHPDTKTPHVTRVALAPIDGGLLVSLISDLAPHSRALAFCPACSLLVGEAPNKGDPLAFPRMTLTVTAEVLNQQAKQAMKPAYLDLQPKARVYYDFADFRLFRFAITSVDLNGGFGKAYHLTPDDLTA